MATHVVFTSPPSARLTDVVSGALGSGVRKTESSVIIPVAPGLTKMTEAPLTGGSLRDHSRQETGDFSRLTLTTLRTYFWQNSVEMLGEKSHRSLHVPLSFGPLLKCGPNFF